MALGVFAQDLYVETLDEQRSSNNLLVLRYRIFNNTSVTIRDASLRYCFTKSPNKTVEMKNGIPIVVGAKASIGEVYSKGQVWVRNRGVVGIVRYYGLPQEYSTILHVNEHIQWNTVIENRNFDAVAEGFKLYYYGSERFFVHGVWAGTLIAPNAKLVLGQTHNKVLYGQFYGKGVVVHQYSKVYKVPFNPQKTITSSTLLDVAWFGVQK